jgi:ABC-type antimicrobial peptide transport system permease subunit
MTGAGLRTALGSEGADITDYTLVRWRNGVDAAAASERLSRLADGQSVFAMPAELPSSVVELGKLRSLPIALTIFFALLAIATVGHALVTTVRRRRHDLAILRSIGFTRRQARLAITWQATLLTIVGLVVGIPLGIVCGRLVWRWLADSFPVAYVPPLALVAIVVVIPIAIVLASVLAAPPAHAATRIRPAQALRTE